jgi:uncharacterized protein YqeY
VQRLIEELKVTSKKDIGVADEAAMARYKGELDGKLVQKIASELLA